MTKLPKVLGIERWFAILMLYCALWVIGGLAHPLGSALGPLGFGIYCLFLIAIKWRSPRAYHWLRDDIF